MNTNSHITALSLLAALAVASAGCATSQAPVEGEEADIAVSDLQKSLLEDAVHIEMGQLADGTFGVTESAGGRAVAPGVWEIETEDGLRQELVAGPEGHRWLSEQMAAQIDDLQSRIELGEGDREALVEQLEAAEELLAASQAAVNDPAQAAVVPAVTCNVGLYTGPSGPITSPVIPGAAALAQMSCTGGCKTFTVRSQACCSGLCTPLTYATKSVCSALWTAGSIRQGSGAGAAQVYVAPVTQTNTAFSCY